MGGWLYASQEIVWLGSGGGAGNSGDPSLSTFTSLSTGGMLRTSFRTLNRPFSAQPTAFAARQTVFVKARTMASHHGFGESTVRPKPDQVLQDIADYVHDYNVTSNLAWETARLCLIDTIGCGLEGLRFPECVRLMGPVVDGTVVPNGMYLNNRG